MSKSKVIIIGAGLGGLLCGAILAKEGLQVTVVDKNTRVGGCLQSYQRNGSIFDTGMHIFGGMHTNGNIRRIFDYLGITDKLNIRNLDPNNDIEVFVNKDKKLYSLSMNRASFVNSFSKSFPSEESNLKAYLEKVDAVMDQLDLFHLRKNSGKLIAANPDFLISANGFVSKYISDSRLQNLLSVINILYAGELNVTPAFLHSSITTIFFNGACRIAGGYESLASALRNVIIKQGGKILVNNRVNKIITNEGIAVGIENQEGQVIKGDTFIMASPVTDLVDLIDDADLFSKGYRTFMSAKEDSLSSFIINIRLKKDSIRYTDCVGFYIDDYDKVWDDSADISCCRFLYMTPPVVNQGDFAEAINVVIPMKWNFFEKWAHSLSGHRDSEYIAYKEMIVNTVLEKLTFIYPNLTESVEYVDSASPLSIRDFTGVRHGAMCGIKKNCHDLIPFIPLQTKIPNLLLTGQSINMHGFCGVTLTAIQTCEAILGQDYLIHKLN